MDYETYILQQLMIRRIDLRFLAIRFADEVVRHCYEEYGLPERVSEQQWRMLIDVIEQVILLELQPELRQVPLPDILERI